MNKFGNIDYLIEGRELFIMYLDVAENARRKGHASKLVKQVINKHRSEIDSVVVPCDASKLALLFWLDMGFEYCDDDEKNKASIILNSDCDDKEIFDIDDNCIIQMIKKYDR